VEDDLKATYLLIPIKPFGESKSRLRSLFSVEERTELVKCLMKDFAIEIRKSNYVKATVVCTADPKVKSFARKLGFATIQEEADRGIRAAIKQLTSTASTRGAKIVVDASIDLPLFSDLALDRMIEMSEPKSAVFTIWRNGGVSTLLRRPPDIVTMPDEPDELELNLLVNAMKSKGSLKYCDSLTLSLDLDLPLDVIQSYIYLSYLKQRSHLFQFLQAHIGGVRKRNGNIVEFLPGPKFVRKLDLIRISGIIRTVRTDAAKYQKLIALLSSKGILTNPVLYDPIGNFLIDGHRRVEALQSMGFERVPVQFVKFEDPVFTVGIWVRVISGLAARHQLEDIIIKLGLEAAECVPPSVYGDHTYLVYPDKCLRLIGESDDPWERMEKLASIEKQMRDAGLSVRLETVSDAHNTLVRGDCDVLLIPRSVSKEQTLQAIFERRPFATVENRSIIPGRILHTDVSLDLLGSKLSDNDARRMLRKKLRERWLSYVEPGSWIESRRYEEDVFVFDFNQYGGRAYLRSF
jgi:2-phospho-L-lactate guanylyltransferase (CobY/MobA/RfbA family)